MKLLVVLVLSLAVAQILPSCDGGSEVVGWVDEKYVDRSVPGPRYMIVINTIHYDVDFGFWNSVQIGDLVKFDGVKWSIVRKRSSRGVILT